MMFGVNFYYQFLSGFTGADIVGGIGYLMVNVVTCLILFSVIGMSDMD